MSPLSNLRRARLGAVAAAVAALCALPATAADRYWGYAAGCGSADFTSASCWRLGAPGNPGGGTVAAAPATGDNVFLMRDGPDSLTNSFANSASPNLPVYRSLTLSGTGGGVVGLNVVRNTLQVSGDTYLGDGTGRGRIAQSAGAARFNVLWMKNGSEYALSGGNMSLTDLWLDGSSTFSQTGGNVVTNTGSLLFMTGRYFLDAGSLDIRNSTFWSNSAGTLELGGGTLLTNAEQEVRASTINFIGGDALMLRDTRLVANTLNVRNDFGYRLATFAANVTANALNVGGLTGNDSDANFSAGTHTINGTMTLSAASGKTSRAFIQNAGTSMTTQGLEVGRGDAAATGAGRVLVNAGAALVVNGTANVGRQGQNSNNSALGAQTGGTVTVTGPMNVYGSALANGAGSRLTVNGRTTIGHAGTPNLQAQLSADGGGALVGSAVSVLAGGSVVLSNASSLNVSGAFDNQTGANVQVLSGSTATFEGSYHGGGGLEIGAGSTVNFRGSLYRPAGSGFSGIGTANYAAPVTLDLLSSAINDAGSFNLLSTATTEAIFMGFLGGSTGRLAVGGNLGFGGSLKVVAVPATFGTEYALGSRYDLFDWGSTSGQFSSFDFSRAPLAAGLVWDTSELYSAGVLKVSAVPEPGTVAMWLAGLAVMGSLVRRRRA